MKILYLPRGTKIEQLVSVIVRDCWNGKIVSMKDLGDIGDKHYRHIINNILIPEGILTHRGYAKVGRSRVSIYEVMDSDIRILHKKKPQPEEIAAEKYNMDGVKFLENIIMNVWGKHGAQNLHPQA